VQQQRRASKAWKLRQALDALPGRCPWRRARDGEASRITRHHPEHRPAIALKLEESPPNGMELLAAIDGRKDPGRNRGGKTRMRTREPSLWLVWRWLCWIGLGPLLLAMPAKAGCHPERTVQPLTGRFSGGEFSCRRGGCREARGARIVLLLRTQPAPCPPAGLGVGRSQGAFWRLTLQMDQAPARERPFPMLLFEAVAGTQLVESR